MSTEVAVAPFEGTYEADKAHSTFGFAVKHGGLSTFRGTLADVDASVTAGGDGLALEGTAKAESISIQNPPQFRAHVLDEEFFDVERYPDVTFRSTDVALGDDGSVTVAGELTIKDVTRPVTATGTYVAPQPWAGGGKVVAFELTTTFDRRDYGFNWQMEMPTGQLAMDWDITLEIHLELIQPDQEA